MQIFLVFSQNPAKDITPVNLWKVRTIYFIKKKKRFSLGGGGNSQYPSFFLEKVQMSGYQTYHVCSLWEQVSPLLDHVCFGENEGILSMSIKLPFKVKNNQGQLHLFSKFSGPSWCECLVKLCLRTRGHESKEENPMRFFPTETI